jgi:hypothetical protein
LKETQTKTFKKQNHMSKSTIKQKHFGCCMSQLKLFLILIMLLPFSCLAETQRLSKQTGPQQKVELLPLNAFYDTKTYSQKANTADFDFTPLKLAKHIKAFREDKNNAVQIFPDELVLASLTKPSNPKKPTVILFYKSSESKNRAELASLLNLWSNHKEEFNFVLIDPEKTLNYYAMIFVNNYWKKEDLKVLALDSSGKIKIQLAEIAYLSRLDADLTKLALLNSKKSLNQSKDAKTTSR